MSLDQQQRERPPEQDAPWNKSGPSDGGPRAPNIVKPDTSRIIKRMREIESNQAKKYRQRSGE